MLLENKKHIHFIGIGGSGMYPIAQILHDEGYTITGSDNNETDTLRRVREMGIPVTLGQRAENIEGADLIIHTAAIMDDGPTRIWPLRRYPRICWLRAASSTSAR